jgi:hypothetical protein
LGPIWTQVSILIIMPMPTIFSIHN